jgi:hypothetical protein
VRLIQEPPGDFKLPFFAPIIRWPMVGFSFMEIEILPYFHNHPKVGKDSLRVPDIGFTIHPAGCPELGENLIEPRLRKRIISKNIHIITDII